MGALSPRTRNAQVQLYQSGEVDFLVATDAIGMGLNLDIGHVAFSSLIKFDGHRMRPLQPDELAQIAGRAGRHLTEGTFGVTGEAPEPGAEVIEAIESHQFRPVTRLQWRNARLQFGSVGRLIQTLEERTENPWLMRVRESDDLAALRALAADAEVAARASDGPSVRLLWDVCRIPDFRGISRGEHAALLAQIYGFLHERGAIPSHWLAAQIERIDRTEGDIDTLSRRLAHIRTWTYVAQRRGWTGQEPGEESHWREVTRAVEDRLSDALHGALTQRFVDRRTSVLARRLRQKEVLVAEVSDSGEVTVEGEFVGRLEGFRFRMDKAAGPDEARTLRQATVQALGPQFVLRADRFYNAPDTEIDFTEQGGLMWGSAAVGRLAAGADALRPTVVAFVDEEAGPEVAAKVQRRLQHFIDRRVAAAMEPLLALQRDEALSGIARGFAFRLVENFGIIPRGEVAEEVKALDQEARGALRKHGIRFGQFTVFMPPLLKPAPTRLRLVLWGLAKGLSEFPASPPPGHVTVPAARDAAPGYYAMAGYRAAGERAIRIDMLERLADMLRERDGRAGFEAAPEMLSITGLPLEGFAALMTGLGYRAARGERARQRPAKVQAAGAADVTAGSMAAAMAAAMADVAPGDAHRTPPEALPEVVPEAPPAVPGEAPEAAPPEVPQGPEEVPEGLPPELPGTEIPEMTAEAAPEAAPGPVETEIFYLFTWGGRGPRRDQRGERGGERRRTREAGPTAAAPAGEGEAAAPGEAAPDGGQPRRGRREGRQDGPGREGRGEGRGQGKAPAARQGRPARAAGDGRAGRGDRPDGADRAKPEAKGGTRPQSFEARPPRDAEKGRRIDPDNPFAAALMGFKPK
jgi:ATP-dependent RNA helicase SUPV3L1/SUV3